MTGHDNLIQELEGVIAHGTAERRGDALRAVAELFAHNSVSYSDDQIALFDDVIVRLMAEIEVAARAALAARLAPIANAPLKVIHALAADDAIEVAQPVLVHSERLDESALVSAARTKGQSHLLAISQRRALAAAITDVLVERGDEAVVLSTVKNTGARFSDTGFTILVRRADGNDAIAERVGQRPEIPRHQFLKLLAIASQGVRDKLEAANPQAVGEIHKVVAEVANRIQSNGIAQSLHYSEAEETVGRLYRDKLLDEREIDGLARAGKFEAVVVAIALKCEVPIDVVERAMLQERPELLLILVKGIGMTWGVTKAILQLRSRDRAISTNELDQHLASFERLKSATAQQVLRFHQTGRGRA